MNIFRIEKPTHSTNREGEGRGKREDDWIQSVTVWMGKGKGKEGERIRKIAATLIV